MNPANARLPDSAGDDGDDGGDKVEGLLVQRAESVLLRSSFSGLTMRYLDFAACADRDDRIRSRMRLVCLAKGLEGDSGVPRSSRIESAARYVEVRICSRIGASSSEPTLVGEALVGCAAPPLLCLFACAKVGLRGGERRLALEESLPLLSVRTGGAAPRSEADLATQLSISLTGLMGGSLVTVSDTGAA